MDRLEHVVGRGAGLHQPVTVAPEALEDGVDPRGHLGAVGRRRRPRPRASGRGPGRRRPHDRDVVLSHASVSPGRPAFRQDVGMPRARETGIRIGVAADAVRPTRSSTCPASAWVTPRSSATSRRRPTGRGSARTGVTTLLLAEDAYLRPLAAGGAVLNGAGECTGFLTAREWGAIETPVYLTSTMQLGRVYDAACEIALEQHGGVADDVVIPVVGECDDSFLNDCRRMQVDAADVRSSYDEAGTVARRHLAAARGRRGRRHRDVLPGLQGRHRDGVPGDRRRAHRRGAAAHQLRRAAPAHRRPGCRWAGCCRHRTRRRAPPAGSCIGVVVTDAPVDAAGCARLARRIGLGPGPDRVDRAPRQRRDLPGRVDHVPGRPGRHARGGTRGSPVAASTRCSGPSSTPPRRRC